MLLLKLLFLCALDTLSIIIMGQYWSYVTLRTYIGARDSLGLKGFSRVHLPVLFRVWMTSSLLKSSYGHWAKLKTSHSATPNDLHI